MTKNQEAGIALNVANYQSLLSYCTGFGKEFNPSNPNIQLSALEQQLDEMTAILSKVNDAKIDYTEAVTNREAAFDALPNLVTRIINAVSASGVSQATLEDLKPTIRKLRGQRATPKPSQEPTDPSIPSEKTNSVSQQSFENRIQNFEILLQSIAKLDKYAPNESDLSMEGLNKALENLKTKNLEAKEAYILLTNLRIQRNKLFTAPETGVLDRVQSVKQYTKSLFGSKSEYFRQISGLLFKYRN